MVHSRPHLAYVRRPRSVEQFKIGLLTQIRSLLDRAKANTRRSAESYRKYHDHAAKLPPYVRVGDQVYTKRPVSYVL